MNEKKNQHNEDLTFVYQSVVLFNIPIIFEWLIYIGLQRGTTAIFRKSSLSID